MCDVEINALKLEKFLPKNTHSSAKAGRIMPVMVV